MPFPALVGRTAELAALDEALDARSSAAGRARSSSSGRRASARRRLAGRARRPRRRRAGTSCSPARRPSSSRTCRSGSSSTRSTSTSRGSTRGGSSAWTPAVRAELGQVLPGAGRRRRRASRGAPRALPHPPGDARAARAARGHQAARAGPRRLPLGRLRLVDLARRAAAPAAGGRRAAGAGARGRASCRRGWRPRWSARTAPGRSPASSSGALTREEARELLGAARDDR